MMVSKIIITIIFIWIGVSPISAQPLDFFRETIQITVKDSSCVLSGMYYFRNTGEAPIRRMMFYPFPVSEGFPYPDSVEVVNLSNDEKTPFKKTEKGGYFPIKISSKDTTIYRIIYHQQTPSNKMEYILTTTKHWRKPFEQAEYVLKMPVKYELLFTSIKFDEEQDNGYKSILWDGTDDKGNEVSSGSYIYILEAGDTIQSKPMLLVR